MQKLLEREFLITFAVVLTALLSAFGVIVPAGALEQLFVSLGAFITAAVYVWSRTEIKKLAMHEQSARESREAYAAERQLAFSTLSNIKRDTSL